MSNQQAATEDSELLRIRERLRKLGRSPDVAVGQDVPRPDSEHSPHAALQSHVLRNPFTEVTPERLEAFFNLDAMPRLSDITAAPGVQNRDTLIALASEVMRTELKAYREELDGNANPRQKQAVQAFLRPRFMEAFFFRKIAAALPFLRLARHTVVPFGTAEIQYPAQRNAVHNDPGLFLAQPTADDAEAPLLHPENPRLRSLSTGTYKAAIEFTDRALQLDGGAGGFNLVGEKLTDMTYAMEFLFNTLYRDEIAKEFDQAVNNGLEADDQILFKTIQDRWDLDGANIIDDIIDGVTEMKDIDEEFAEANELWVNNNTWTDIWKAMVGANHVWALHPQADGSTLIVIGGVRIVNIQNKGGIPDGNAILMATDANRPILQVWDEIDPRFSRSNMIHVIRVEKEDPIRTKFIFKRTLALKNLHPKRVMVFEGIR